MVQFHRACNNSNRGDVINNNTFNFRKFACAISCLLLMLEYGIGQEKNASAVPKTTELVGLAIEVRLNDGSWIGNAEVVTVNEGKLPESIRSIKLQTPGSKRMATIAASKIEEIYVKDVPLYVAYDKKNRCLVHSIEKKLDQLEYRRNVEKRLSGTGDRFWNPLSDDEHQQFMDKHREFLKKTESKLTNIRFRLVETRYFLFFTDLAPAEVDGYIVYLDAMYRELCQAFGLSPEKNIWCGKCVVVAFGRRQDFLQFEAEIMNNPNAAGAQGLCHQTSDGTVIFSGYKGDNGFFGHVLVHETSHGFVHRYLTTARAPSWLNEGMADWLANVIVKGTKIPTRQKNSAILVKRQNGWGDFLTTGQISGDYYGSASTLVEILVARDQGGQFKAFFDGIKEGKPADESLKDAFGISYRDLKILYAQAISRLPN